MLLLKTLEYLFYLLLLAFMCKYAQAASLQPTEATAAPTMPAETLKEPQKEPMRNPMDDCEISAFSWMCLKIEFVKIMERLAELQEVTVLPGVSVVKDVNATELKTSELMAEVARSYPSDPNTRLNGYILAKIENLLKTRFLRFRLLDDKGVREARSAVESGRKHKFGKKGGLEALIAAGVMMKGMMMAMGFGAIALIAGKALMTALMALTLSGVLGLKSLAGGGKSTTYEIVAKPIYTSSHSHSVSHEDGHGHSAHYGGGGGGGLGTASGYGGYGRALNLEPPSQLQKL
ncbi:uncharacterized protein LOC115621998 [Scaptodrosophila lebanonensis]|uniref:Uncharacterized protein LOC115621998 n=1 Tax=Drosophila lebanonensis TaxID=7225 RepID=A0A6J2T998_DROLE|nr:uncharacterized protein LOC115621998 [Scaptodrosophila lebanonensis]